jgi:DNA mismatch endonuclease (patch repair protein)
MDRSENMRRIRGKDTKPEWIVRRLVYALGFRYRLHRKVLPGKPDLAFIGKRKVIFVHGCFWHKHSDPACKIARLPKSRTEYWLPKLERNRSRDAGHLAALRDAGWEVLTIWECEVKDEAALAKRIRRFLKP